jgi:hypothetical protein
MHCRTFIYSYTSIYVVTENIWCATVYNNYDTLEWRCIALASESGKGVGLYIN